MNSLVKANKLLAEARKVLHDRKEYRHEEYDEIMLALAIAQRKLVREIQLNEKPLSARYS